MKELFTPNISDTEVAFRIIASFLVATIIAYLPQAEGPHKWLIRRSRIRKFIFSSRILLLYSPDRFLTEIQFHRDGHVNEDHGDQGRTWRIRRGELEIKDADGNLHSRFRFIKWGSYLLDADNIDTSSYMRQSICYGSTPKSMLHTTSESHEHKKNSSTRTD